MRSITTTQNLADSVFDIVIENGIKYITQLTTYKSGKKSKRWYLASNPDVPVRVMVSWNL